MLYMVHIRVCKETFFFNENTLKIYCNKLTTYMYIHEYS